MSKRPICRLRRFQIQLEYHPRQLVLKIPQAEQTRMLNRPDQIEYLGLISRG